MDMEVGWWALVVSALALGLSTWNTIRATRKDRPYWGRLDKVSRAGKRASQWRVTIRNYGHAPAGDARLFLSHQLAPEPVEVAAESTLALGEQISASVNVDPLSNQTLESLKVIIKWRQAPSFDRERTKAFHFPMSQRHTDAGRSAGLGD